MSLVKKIDSAKADFLIVCQQYSKLGELSHSASIAMNSQDYEAYNILVKAYSMQFRELGEQLKQLGSALDRLGGQSVMHAPKG